jgi:hypothetical protein
VITRVVVVYKGGQGFLKGVMSRLSNVGREKKEGWGDRG